MEKIGFIGFGLIGGSLALSLRASRPDCTLLAYRYREPADPGMEQAVRDGALDYTVSELSAFSDCDFLFLCAPVLTNVSYLEKLKSIVRSSCILTDVGSVKSGIEQAALSLGLGSCFIGGHPMAGSEKTGYVNASPRLLENAYYLLTPTPETPADRVEALRALIAGIGAIPVLLDADRHDRVTAAISHVPHILAAALVNLVSREDDEAEHMRLLAAGGFRDITRIASSSPAMWKDICLSNEDSILDFLSKLDNTLQSFKKALGRKDADYLYRFFSEAREYRDTLPNKPSGAIKAVYEVYADIADETGAIAKVAGILAGHSISMKNIGIVHNREFEEGALRIAFYEEAAAETAAGVLSGCGYTVCLRS